MPALGTTIMKKVITVLINLAFVAGILLLSEASPTCQMGGWWSCLQHHPDGSAFELAVQQAKERDARLDKLEHPHEPLCADVWMVTGAPFEPCEDGLRSHQQSVGP